MINHKVRPQLSIIPTLISAIEKPGRDQLARRVAAELGPLARKIVTKWKAVPNEKKMRRFCMRQP